MTRLLPRALAAALALLAFGRPDSALADVGPGPGFVDPCEGKPDGTPCDNSRGLCRQVPDERGGTRPDCLEDSHQCDRLGVGAICKAEPLSHCVRFTGDRGETWIGCQDDALQAALEGRAPPTNPPAPAPPPTPPAAPPPAPSRAPAPPHGMCSLAHRPVSSAPIVAVVSLLAFASTLRRRQARAFRARR